ncbi:MAG: hypothetical protein ACUVQP_01940 [Bacteroidales bacterium]
MFKPFYSLLFLLLLGVVFVLFSFLPSKFSLASFEIKIPKISLKFKVEKKKLTSNAQNVIKLLEKEEQDTLQKTKDSLLHVNEAIAYADSTYSALSDFFEAIENNKKIHVLHYGDSQIEGDRISGDIRHYLQTDFGGTGAGFIIPIKVNAIEQAIKVENNGEWKRYTLFGKRNKNVKHHKYGPLLQFVRYAPIMDSLTNDSLIYEASLAFKPNPASYGSNYKFNTVKICYGNLKRPVLVQLYDGDKFLTLKTLNPTSVEQIESFELESLNNELIIEFTGKDSPDIYGFSFESSQGIWVDNVPMRGSSGTEIAFSSLSHLSVLYRSLNVKLIIYEFGVNVVPYISKDYDYYEQWVYQQLTFLKQAYPNMSILVVGVSDMSMNTDSGLVSYPNIELIRDAQKRAAFKAGCAFWDTYSAMGGRNSMPVWVNLGLAAKDYTHFTAQGASKIAKMLYNALYNDYIKYKKHKKINL